MNKALLHGRAQVLTSDPASIESLIALRDLLTSYGYSSGPAAIGSAIVAIRNETAKRAADNSLIYKAMTQTFEADAPDGEKIEALVALSEIADAGGTLDDFLFRRKIEAQTRDCADMEATQACALGTLY